MTRTRNSSRRDLLPWRFAGTARPYSTKANPSGCSGGGNPLNCGGLPHRGRISPLSRRHSAEVFAPMPHREPL
jgi:hypothetical protein